MGVKEGRENWDWYINNKYINLKVRGGLALGKRGGRGTLSPEP